MSPAETAAPEPISRRMEPRASSRPALSPGKRRLFRILVLTVIVLGGLVATEAVLRRNQAAIGRSNRIDPGLVKYDRELGWRLAPDWQGAHVHRDFNVRYAVGARGLRADTPGPVRTSGRPLALALGDSYTFGYGVGDDETFVHLLDRQAVGGFDYVNAGVPGYSTDQQAMLLVRELRAAAPRRVLLFVYVGNDLIDNARDVPLQLRTPKPRFEVAGADLVLRNVPVPVRTDVRVEPWWPVVLGPDPARWSARTRLELRYELFRLLAPPLPRERDYRPEFGPRFAGELALFERILEGMTADCARRGIEFVAVPITGAAYLHAPASPAGQYQEFFVDEVVRRLRARGVAVVDLPGRMRERFRREGGRWYFPHDGHPNVAGHRVIATILADELGRSGLGNAVSAPPESPR